MNTNNYEIRTEPEPKKEPPTKKQLRAMKHTRDIAFYLSGFNLMEAAERIDDLLCSLIHRIQTTNSTV